MTEDDLNQVRKVIVLAIADYWSDRERVKEAVRAMLESLEEETAAGAGKALFRGVRRVGWIVLIAFVVFGLGGWTALVAFIKGIFAHG
jgi:hypothetical protein